MKLGERGSSSVLFLGLVVPVMSLFLVLGVELQQFFGIREDIQRIVDAEARFDAARSGREDDVTQRLRKEFIALLPYVEITEMRHLREGGRTSIGVSGTFKGIFTRVVTAFSDESVPGISFSVRAEARHPRVSVLVAIDRRIEGGDRECDNEQIERREEIARDLLAGVAASESADIQVGTFPGGDDGFLLLGSGTTNQDVRCSDTGSLSPAGTARLRGVATSSALGLEGAFAMARALLELGGSADISAVIMVAINDQEGLRAIFDVGNLLALEATTLPRKTKVLGFVVGNGDTGVDEIWRGDLSNVGIRIVPIAESGRVDPAVISAAVHDLTSHVVMAR